jgi:hypothetical protein
LRRRATGDGVSALPQPDLRRPWPAPPPSRRYQSTGYRAKKLLLGPALTTSQLTNERVSKRVALVLHDHTSSGLTRVLGTMENVNVTIVPFHLGGQPQLYAVKGT